MITEKESEEEAYPNAKEDDLVLEHAAMEYQNKPKLTQKVSTGPTFGRVTHG